MAGLISALPGLWSKLRAEMLAFADFLEQLPRSDDEEGRVGDLVLFVR